MTTIPRLTVEQMQDINRRATEEYGISSLQMLENAGRALAEVTRQRLNGSVERKQIIVLGGAGNTGAAGLCAARHLHNWGAKVYAILSTVPEELSDAGRHQLQTLRKSGVAIWRFRGESADDAPVIYWERTAAIVDALVGHEVDGDPGEPDADMIRLANANRKPIISLVVPSGLDATTGAIYSPCIDATATVALGLPTIGLMESRIVAGDIYLADIGVPPDLYGDIGVDVGNVFANAGIIPLDA